jgi:hypothetical protein
MTAVFNVIHSFINGPVALYLALTAFSFQFFNHIHRRLGSLDLDQRRKAVTYTLQHSRKINTQTSMVLVGIEPTNTVFGRAKTFHALHRAITVTGVPNSICS